MHPRAFRFSPPRFEMPPAGEWCLARAFSRAETAPAIPAPGECLRWARSLGLSPRIAGKTRREVLVADLGEETAGELLRDHRDTVARSALLDRQVATLSEAARHVESPVILLKGSALLAGRFVRSGLRPRRDVDALVPKERAEALARALRERGFGPSDEMIPPWHHHLPALRHEQLGYLELHLFLPGISVAGSTATAEALLEGGLSRPVPSLDRVHVPVPVVLAAHAVVHALVEHAFWLLTHPLQMAADVLDLAGESDSSGVARLIEAARPYLVESVSERELAAVSDLCSALATGNGTSAPEDASRLLRHSLAGFVDDDYFGFLRVHRVLEMLRARNWRELARLCHDVVATRPGWPPPGSPRFGSRREGATREDGRSRWPRRVIGRLARGRDHLRSWLAVRRKKG